ncbi:MAG: DUF2807 domain-containing protein [Clostridia bacterium]|nr:DUF2807 domain-containing protein [Clostridia bacterium]
MKHRYLFVILLLLAALPLLCSCGHVRLSGTQKQITVPLISEEDTAQILELRMNFENGGKNPITVLPTPEDTQPYAVISYPADLEKYGFFASYEEGCLRIGTDKDRIYRTEDFSVTVYAPVSEYRLTGNLSLYAEYGDSFCDRLSLNVTGGSACSIQGITCGEVRFSVEGAAHITVSGTTDTMTAQINGAAALDAQALLCRSVRIQINGASSAGVYAMEALDAEINGVGSIVYDGPDTLNVKKQIFGAGAVTKKGTS